MNKKKQKMISIVAAVSLILSMTVISPVRPVLADTLVPVSRLGGSTRYSTATSVALARADGRQMDAVILVSGESAYDALSATALASKLNAPILLTPAGKLDPSTASALVTLGAKTIYIVGGIGAVSQPIRDGLIKSGHNLVELGGKDRYDTNVNVANYLVKTIGLSPSKVLMTGGMNFPDALSVAPVAAAEQEILLLVNNGNAAANTATNKFVKDNSSTVTVIGTKNLVSDSELAELGATRVNGGSNRYATNMIVNNYFDALLNKDSIYVATAAGFADALVGATAAGVTKSPLILIDTETSSATATGIAYIKSLSPKTAVNIVGGTGVITSKTLSDINIAANNLQTYPAGTYQLGKTATIHDTFFGTYELTINSVELTAERNEFDASTPAEVYKINYTYKLLSKGTETSMGLSIYDFDSYADSNGEMGDWYPNTPSKDPKELVNVGNYCTAETFVGVHNPTDRLTLTKSYSTDDGYPHVTFVIPTNN
ncbi:cell wall-binding repeat-containing protein [Clostridium bowmanii]|uniref:cell wall-binding repeat-containing protein n=1 Tax=Clostridium bowmanii TaxID=132925 RepID=UPI001C0C3C63|nr:cell wall-binding repeat-containing protein [Clostridium bowmanii]MBU3190788.1 cell wall-binding repeat-containing protein [Clostridium bowmanii]MCA1075308.1 cell wall-binding repeat-containing protein [Clostridium bowmanii]